VKGRGPNLRKRRLLRATLPLAALGLVLARLAGGIEQPPALTGEVTGAGFTRIPIAIAEPAAESSAKEWAREFAETVRSDLEYSGYFDVLPAPFQPASTSPPTDRAAFDEWVRAGADSFVISKLAASSGRLDLLATLYDARAGQQLLARRYGGSEELLRRIAHQVADDLVFHFTGRKGISTTRIAFVSCHGKAKELYLMDYDGRRVRRLTTSGTINLTPVWSPVGERLAYVSFREGRPGIYVLESDGRIWKVPTAGGTLNTSPDWSPDGRSIAYASNAGGSVDLYVVDLATGRSRRLTDSPAIDTSPSFSPNGREIAFTSDRSGSPQIYIVDVDGLNLRRLTTAGNYNESAAWSPRGDRIAYVTRNERGRFDIAVLDLATGAVRQLTDGEGSNENPRWSPDGRHLVFSSNRAGTYDIYTMDADGGNLRRLTQGTDSITPDWSH